MKLPRSICPICEKECKRPQDRYCSNKCQQLFQYYRYIDRWKNGLEDGLKGTGVSKYLIRYLRNRAFDKCERCGWGTPHPLNNIAPLEVEHIDGNWLNNKEENLILLCPNCHSLTLTYKNRNRGNGRPQRRIN